MDLVLTEKHQRWLSLTNLIAQFSRVDSVLLMLTMVNDLAVTLDASAVATQNSQDHTDHNHFRNDVHTTKFDLVQTVLWFVTLDVSAVATQNSQDHTDHNHFRNDVHTTKFDLVQTVLWFGIVPQEIPWA